MTNHTQIDTELRKIREEHLNRGCSVDCGKLWDDIEKLLDKSKKSYALEIERRVKSMLCLMPNNKYKKGFRGGVLTAIHILQRQKVGSSI